MAFESVLDANIIGFSDLSGIKWDNTAPTPQGEASHATISSFFGFPWINKLDLFNNNLHS